MLALSILGRRPKVVFVERSNITILPKSTAAPYDWAVEAGQDVRNPHGVGFQGMYDARDLRRLTAQLHLYGGAA